MKYALVLIVALTTGCATGSYTTQASTTEYIRNTQGQTVARIKDGRIIAPNGATLGYIRGNSVYAPNGTRVANTRGR